ncbi:MAG: efflux RND transporter permease subunit [Planctomycetota bacterium]|nr:efflux RND transporter permease subunit [Planctomycetota bacterium]
MTADPDKTPTTESLADHAQHGWTNGIVRSFLHSNLPIILLILSVAIGLTAVTVTPREEDPQIVVPMADVYVSAPGLPAAEVERLVATPLEKILYQIDGVEYVYSMSREGQAIITVRYYVGEDRERSLVKLSKTIEENRPLAPPGVAWVVKPVEIDDVPIVNLTLTSPDNSPYTLRRIAEEVVARLSAVQDVSRAYIVGGQPRKVQVHLDRQRMRGYNVSPLEIQRAVAGANVRVTAGQFTQADAVFTVESGRVFTSAADLHPLVVGVFNNAPVFLKDVADVVDGPDEVSSYVRHGWGPARGFSERAGTTGSLIGEASGPKDAPSVSQPAVTIALSKKKGANAVTVAQSILAAADKLKTDVVPANVEMVVTRNTGLNSNDKVNDLIEALGVALVLAVAVLTVALGWRESLIVALAVPVVFGLTLGVNLLAGLTINRVTLFALILSLGLLVDDPIVDVENIVRHFFLRRKATRPIVLEAVSEIRPPLITATLAVIASFLPLFFISGMMGPYMRPMALNVPVTMLMSMVVAFTITPWLTYHILKRRYNKLGASSHAPGAGAHGAGDVKATLLYRLFSPVMGLLLKTRRAGWAFLALMGLLLVLAAGMAMMRIVPLKMLPDGNKSDLQLVLDFDNGTTLERSDAAVGEIERYLAGVSEVTDFTSYVGLAAPMDFNGMVRHFYLRQGPNVADVQINFVDRKERPLQTHPLTLRLRNDLTDIARRHGARLKIVEAPPGPPVLSTVVAEVYGRESTPYADLVAAAGVVHRRLAREPGVVDVDDMTEAAQVKYRFVPDQEKAALHGVSVEEIARTQQMLLAGAPVGTVQQPGERNPLLIDLRLGRPMRSSTEDLAMVFVKGANGSMVPLAELGRWETLAADQTIYHKNLRPVMYVLAEMAGRPPADAVMDIQADQAKDRAPDAAKSAAGFVSDNPPRAIRSRTFLANGGGIPWALAPGIDVSFLGEGEWKLTLDVFRDMGLAFIAALIAIYILLVHQTKSFAIPLIVMMAIPLTIIGIMPGFWLLNVLSGGTVGGFGNPTFFTATAMIGMIALAGIVTRSSIIIVDFVHLSLGRGRSLKEAIIESCVVRLRPILLTAGVAMLSALPIATDPIFSGLAWALIFGLLASTVFTLLVIPVVYSLLYSQRPGHGVAGTVD